MSVTHSYFFLSTIYMYTCYLQSAYGDDSKVQNYCIYRANPRSRCGREGSHPLFSSARALASPKPQQLCIRTALPTDYQTYKVPDPSTSYSRNLPENHG